MEERVELAPIRYVAIGDSFTEGVGDEQSDGSVRGWADLVAQGLADSTGQPIQYANLAIRGRLLAPIIAEQLEPALALEPTLLSFNGGGNDMLRPGTDMPWIIEQTEKALRRILETDTEPLLLAGANPTIGLPRGESVRAKGNELTEAAGLLATELNVRFCDNWSDPVLARREYWSSDRLHLGPIGHHRVATNVLHSLGHFHPEDWQLDAEPIGAPGTMAQLRYTREHVLPWIKRRLTGKSSGDGRTAKHPDYVWVYPRLVDPHH
ncbi:SGNH/GDSL hydrolase family protein [Leucobacter sp. UT-8R-CII-1-4]|uniref:SGNH/GDSL hydrolase family protein n=1 Tax=Leucobacter sp. UT-8R-CII-1-4 TaxID=3040075 RepID=UPI0024A97A8A|nr:SGNH/GDSL hydrolase family protein [Leucobacter sp. UT-8R-CII-1-4]MDI6023535.1 SGNH/GDSL hydrolase family protein [Leucobacter sp. UT-8R-CII-1-4]